MDYDKLIEHLRECGTYGFKQEECRDAALAIETLRGEIFIFLNRFYRHTYNNPPQKYKLRGWR